MHVRGFATTSQRSGFQQQLYATVVPQLRKAKEKKIRKALSHGGRLSPKLEELRVHLPENRPVWPWASVRAEHASNLAISRLRAWHTYGFKPSKQKTKRHRSPGEDGLGVSVLFSSLLCNRRRHTSSLWMGSSLQPVLCAHVTGARRVYYSSAISWIARVSDGDKAVAPVLPEKVLQARQDLITRVNRIFKETFGERYNVTAFGSTCYGTDDVDSDLDMVILDSQRAQGNVPAEEDPLIIRDVAFALRRVLHEGKRVYIRLQAIPTAIVPILKLQDTVTGLLCDININDRLGIVNTALIRRYCELSPLLRPMIYVIKHWAKTVGLNHPASDGGKISFSSHALALMTIAILQTRGHLPNLQEGCDAVAPRAGDLLWYRRTDHLKRGSIVTKCDTRFFLEETWTPSKQIPDLREALIDWFNHWSQLPSGQYWRSAISVRDGGMAPRGQIVLRHRPPYAPGTVDTRLHERYLVGYGGVEKLGVRTADIYREFWLLKWSPICVYDPFIPARNLTANITMDTVHEFRDRCREAGLLLETGVGISALIRPPVLS